MITNKIAIGAGAIALAVTASLTPLVAQAEPSGDTDSSSSSSDSTSEVGNAAGRKAAQTTRGGAVRPGANTPPQSVVSGAQPEANTPPQSAVSGAQPEANTPPQSVVSGARPAKAPGANAFGPNPLFQNPLWWFGTPNPDAPPPVATRTFEPLAGLPGWSQQYYGWYRDLNFEACVLGLSNSITPSVGPYGTSTSSISTGGC